MRGLRAATTSESTHLRPVCGCGAQARGRVEMSQAAADPAPAGVEIAPGVRVIGPMPAGYGEVLTAEALAFVGLLERRFSPERRRLLTARADRQDRLDHKIREASFDRGFYTPKNLDDLKEIVSLACLPRKGRPRGKALEEESRAEFRRARRRHSGIESAIHGLVVGCGLDRCRDRGEEGYEHYVALAVSGRNLHMLGRLVLERKRRRRKRA